MYSYIYYLILVLGLIYTFYLVSPYYQSVSIKYSSSFSLILILTMIFGMSRTKGIDYLSYKRNYYQENYDDIADYGYTLLSKIFQIFNLPFETLVILSGVLSIFALYRLSTKYKLNLFLLTFFWYQHLFVVLNLGNFRSGFAIAISIIALTYNKYTKYLLYLLSISIHKTALVFILLFEISNYLSLKKNYIQIIIILIPIIISILLFGKFIGTFGFIDERISVYLNWKRDYYGNEIKEFTQLYFLIIILILTLLNLKIEQKERINWIIFYMTVLTIFTFFSFSDTAIFASRFSNLGNVLYPIILAKFILIIKIKLNDIIFQWVPRVFLIIFFTSIFIFRNGSIDIINSVKF